MNRTTGALRRVPRLAPLAAFLVLGALLAAPRALAAQDFGVVRVDLPTGRSHPISTPAAVTRVSVATPEVADVVLITEREFVINGKGPGETDVITWLANGQRVHYRVLVHSPSDRMQILVAIKFAELRKDRLRDIQTSAVYREGGTRVGSGLFRSDNPFDSTLSKITLPGEGRFLSVLTDFDTKHLLGLIELEERKGRGRTLAEPNIMAANKEEASFLAGGELPIPVVQGGGDNGSRVSVEYREFGVRLTFTGEIISDSLIKLKVRPEVSNLDYANAIVLQGFRIPALRTRRVESTLDVRRDQSLVISGFFNNEEERVKRGIPLLQDIPILGLLFSSTSFQRNETELVVVVTPVVVDPMRPRRQDVLRFAPDTALPAREALEKRFPKEGRP